MQPKRSTLLEAAKAFEGAKEIDIDLLTFSGLVLVSKSKTTTTSRIGQAFRATYQNGRATTKIKIARSFF
jgi:hypothetical protein